MADPRVNEFWLQRVNTLMMDAALGLQSKVGEACHVHVLVFTQKGVAVDFGTLPQWQAMAILAEMVAQTVQSQFATIEKRERPL